MVRSSRSALAATLVSSIATIQLIAAQGLVQLRSVQTVSEAGRTVVVIEAEGALPQPILGSAENPPRLYFDFEGVTPKRRGMTTGPGSGLVRQTRVALFTPTITRIVLDLQQLESCRIDASERAAGRIKIAVGAEPTTAVAVPAAPKPPAPTTSKPAERTPPPSTPPSTPPPTPPPTPPRPTPPPAEPTATPKIVVKVDSPPAAVAKPTPPPAPPVPAATPPPAADKPATPSPSEAPAARRRPMFTPPPSAPKPPAREVERYRQRVSGAIERLEAQQPIVMLIDAEGSISSEALQAALTEFSSVRRVLEGVKPSDAMASAHELLMASCTLGATASRLSLEATRGPNEEARKNAASAAAGALMFFDRACADLGCTRAQY